MKLIITFSLLVFSVSLLAQNPVRDVIYLNNGSIIRGNIIEIPDNKTIKIESCENLLVFDMSEVQKITREELPAQAPFENSSKQNGYLNITSFGVLAGTGSGSAESPVSIETVNAYRFNNKYSFGLGLGMDLYDKMHVPVFLDCRYQLHKGNISPVFILKGGYSLPVGTDNSQSYYYTETYSKGGAMIGTGAGILFRMNNNNQMIISLGYHYQQLVTTEVRRNNDVKWTYDHSVKYNRLEIKFGFYFD